MLLLTDDGHPGRRDDGGIPRAELRQVPQVAIVGRGIPLRGILEEYSIDMAEPG
jgi:hypothetical protein